jgi:D-alanine-D-alanine ligase
MSKLHVAVLRGGPSSEYDVSLKTGANVLKHLGDRHHVADIFIAHDGTWHRDGFEKSPDRALRHADVVFNAMHGEYGEDGKVQKLLDNLEIPYTGSNAIASALGMNKLLSKKVFVQHDIQTPWHTVVKKGNNLKSFVQHAFHNYFLPLVVKPITAGSSLGVTIVKGFHELEDALDHALGYSDSVLVEEYIKGKEATCGVIEDFRGQKLYTLMPVEIIPPTANGFFDYDAKYSGTSQEIVPGHFSEEEKEEIQQLARRAHEALGLRHYSRTDIMVHPKKGAYVLEVNTLPGLTDESLLTKSLAAIGCDMPDFLDHIVQLAVRK